MILSDVAIKNRTTVMVMVVMIIIMGTMSYVSLPRESAPDVKVPYIVVTTVNPGAAPEDIENTITTKIENQLTGLKGKKEITSVSSEGVSTITVEFMPDIDIDDALQRVKNKVDLAAPELPKDTDEPIDPVVMEISFADMPIMAVNISGDISPAHMKDIAETLEEEIEAVPGVLGVDVMGALEREIILEIDPDKVSQYGLTITELMKFIPSENVSMTAGGLETTGMKLSVRIPGKFDDPSQINRLPIAVRNGKPIYLTDVAKTMDTFKDTESFSRLDGENSVTLNIKKRVGANIIDIAKHVKAILKVAQTMVPKGIIFTLTTDRSKEINLMVADLENNIFTSLILVVAVLMVFMGLRSSLIVATIIPLSMLMSFAVLQALGITLNMVVLFALILSLGMLVDNAIVIVENIYRFMEMGYDRKEAAMKATSEVAWPVISSTATTVAAFAPLLFWPGIMGDFMSYLPLTVIIVLTCSLIVAMMINPVICSIWGKPQKVKGKDHKQHIFVEKYRTLLNFVLRRPGATLFLSFCLLIAIIVIYGRSGLGVELFPLSDPKEGIISIRLPQGTNVKETDRLAGIIEKRVEKFRKSDTPGQINNFKNVVTNVGTSGGGSSDSGPHTASLTLVFPDYEERIKSSATVMNDVRKELEDFPGAEVKVERRKDGPPTGSAVTIRIIGEDMGVLQKLSEEVSQRIKGTPNMVNMRSDLEAAKPELVFVTDRVQAAIMETDTNSISQFLKTAIYGTKVGEYQQFNDDYDIRLRPEVSKRRGVDDLLKLRVPTLNGGAVPLTSLGHFEYKPGLGTIHRIDRKRVVTVTADAEGRTGLEVLADAQKRLAEMKLPTGYRIEYAGEKEEDDKARDFLSKAFLIALLLIVAILVMQFNTLSVPLIIMSTVILSLIGVFVGLLVFRQPFGVIMTGVGVISLAGVVVNNAIVLLDYTRQLQQRGYSLQDAAVEAGVTRLRPVLLTAGTTVLGLIPMVTGISFDFHTMSIAWKSSSTQWWSNMAVAVIFGLSFATMLTLLVVPSLYVLTSKIAIKWGMNTAPQVHHKPKPNMEDF